MSDSLCTLCKAETTLKCDRNLVEGSGAFDPKSELLNLEIVVVEPLNKYICRKCVDMLKKRKNLKEGLKMINEKIVSLYRTTASSAGKLVKFRFVDEISVKPKKTLLTEKEPVEDYGELSAHEAFSVQPQSQSTPLKQKAATTKRIPSEQVPVKLIVNWPSGVKTRTLLDDLIPLGKSLINGSFRQIASAAWKSEGLRKALLAVLKKEVQKECTCLCSRKVPSCLRQTSKEKMLQFSLGMVEQELEQKAPILKAVLKVASVPRSKEDADESKWLPATTMAAAVLLKNRSSYMTAVQLLITVIIQHSGLMVCTVYIIVDKYLALA
eukprot:Seg3510.1 transcript_id=Seg3510.1/GoldUCD/mRNA.D3Y31 product="hypothetical protein" protein_id=Seg3510.1/GoldUCD/D3Y31